MMYNIFILFKKHYDDFKTSLSFLMRHLSAVILFCVSSFCAFLVADLFATGNILRSIRFAADTDITSIATLSRLILILIYSKSVFAAFAVIGILAWGYIAYLVWIVMRFLIDVGYQVIFPVNTSFLIMTRRYSKVIDPHIKKALSLSLVFLLFVALVLFIYERTWDMSAVETASLLGKTALFFVPIIFLVNWSLIIRLRYSLGKNKKPIERINRYLFSSSSMRRRFKSILDILCYLALLGWFIIPAYFLTIQTLTARSSLVIDNMFDYNGLVKSLNGVSYEIKTEIFAPSGQIPQINQLTSFLDPFDNIASKQSYNIILKTLQPNFFFIVTLGGVLSIGLHVVSALFFLNLYKQAVKKVLIVTLKTLLIVGVLQLVIKKAYFIDISEPIGIGALFNFLMAFYFSHDNDIDKHLAVGTVPVKNRSLPNQSLPLGE